MNLPPNTAHAPADDPLLLKAAREYCAALEAGQPPNHQKFIARFPEIAAELAPYLETLDLLHEGACAPARPSPRDETLPTEPLGDFRILRTIGRGGMGIVYEAVQLSLGRRVALKVLPFAAGLDASQLQRFKNEAQAAAQLHHPNIVPVYFVGCERGVHYYAMQLIEGQNFDSLIGHLRSGTAASPTAPGDAAASTVTAVAAELSTQRDGQTDAFYRTAAGLMIQAATGLDHAHQFGILHRDIKPANLMVDARGTVWVTDFGLARLHTGVGLTRTGDVMGTLRYMSPEQAAGQGVSLDPRADVYSLGATFYELLTLRPMFDGDDPHRLMRQIREEEPRPPRAIDPAVPVELETIVLKAVSKNPADRYAGTREFADDLARFLEDRPILARRPTLLQRGQKWARRHPTVLAAAGVLLVLATVGSLVSTALVHAEHMKAEAAYQRERQRSQEAEGRFRLARRSVDEMIQVSEELRDRPHLQAVRKRLLQSALVYYQEFIDERRDDPATQEDLRDTKARVEKILADLAVLDGAGRLFLLSERDVQEDLGLSGEQRKHLATLRAQALEAGRRLQSVHPDERLKGFVAQVRADEAELRQLLTPEQLLRLRQITLQAQGPTAFSDPAVTARLELTASQRERLRLIEAELYLPPPLAEAPPDGPPPAFRKIHAQRLRQANERALALLTPEQTRRWHQLIGAPFQGELKGPPPPGFPPLRFDSVPPSQK